jgi:hypothetical protein
MEQNRSAETLLLETAQARLAAVWFIGAAIPFVLLVAQSILGRYQDSVSEVWGWFVPSVGPTLGLILGVMGATALIDVRKAESPQREVKLSFFKLAFWLSIAYLTILTLTLLLEPLSSLHGIKLYNVANYWLGPAQTLVVAAITVLFTSQRKSERPESPGDAKKD